MEEKQLIKQYQLRFSAQPTNIIIIYHHKLGNIESLVARCSWDTDQCSAWELEFEPNFTPRTEDYLTLIGRVLSEYY